MGEPDRAMPAHALRLAEWLDARLDGVESELTTRIRSAVGGVSADAMLRDGPHALIAAAVARLEPLAAGGCAERASAADLLAVDALVTLACEALADADATADEIVQGTTSMIRAIAATMPEQDRTA